MIDNLELGQVTATPGALALLEEAGAAQGINGQAVCDQLIRRHAAHDWGDIDDEDAKANTRAIITGGRVMSTYPVGGQELWIITEGEDDQGQRSSTTLLLPAEY